MVVFIFMVHVDVFAVTPSSIFSFMLFKKKNQDNNVLFAVNKSLRVQHGKLVRISVLGKTYEFCAGFLILNDQVLFLLKQNIYIAQG